MELKQSSNKKTSMKDLENNDNIWGSVIRELEGKIKELESENQHLKQQLKQQYSAIQMLGVLDTDSEDNEPEQKMNGPEVKMNEGTETQTTNNDSNDDSNFVFYQMVV